MKNSLMQLLKTIFILQGFCWCFPVAASFGGDTPSVTGTKVYFINLKNGQTVKSPFLVQLGLTSEMGIAPALADWPDTGHHHLIIDSPVPKENKSISNKHIHMHKGQTEITIKLSPGKHTMQLVLADYSHIPHDPPVMSEIITVNVE